MKANKIILTSLLAALVMGACGGKDNISKTETPAEPSSDTLTTSVTQFAIDDSIRNADSTRFAHITTSIKVDYPTEQKSLLGHAISEFINEELGGSCPEDLTARPQTMVNYYGDLTHRMQMAIVVERDGHLFSGLEQDVTIKKIYESDKVVTYNTLIYAYLDGAHGSTMAHAVTFRKSDGRRMDTSMLSHALVELENSQVSKLKKLIIEELKKYFSVKTDAELADVLQLPNSYDEATPEQKLAMLPLPQSAPYMMADGVHFDYGQYEIAAYAAGMPSAVIPYAAIKPFLSTAVLQLIP